MMEDLGVRPLPIAETHKMKIEVSFSIWFSLKRLNMQAGRKSFGFSFESSWCNGKIVQTGEVSKFWNFDKINVQLKILYGENSEYSIRIKFHHTSVTIYSKT